MNSTFFTKAKSYLFYNRFTKLYLTLNRQRLTEYTFEFNMTKYHYHALLVSSFIGKNYSHINFKGLTGFFVQFKNTLTRKDTFTRNYTVLDKALGKEHKDAMG